MAMQCSRVLSILVCLTLSFRSCASSKAPPKLLDQFCSTIEQWVIPNTTTGAGPVPPASSFGPGEHYRLCLDTPNFRYSRKGPLRNMVTHRVDFVWQIFNGTDNFIMIKNETQPGGYGCVHKVLKQPNSSKPLELPWSMVVLDQEAVSKGTNAKPFDGILKTESWQHDRPRKGPFEPGNMTWHITPATEPSRRMLRSSYVHYDPRTKSSNSGERDFNVNFTTTLPEFKVPPGVICHFPKNAFVPADGCKPKCSKSDLCCRDPTSPNDTGACYAVRSCAQLPGDDGDASVSVYGSMW